MVLLGRAQELGTAVLNTEEQLPGGVVGYPAKAPPFTLAAPSQTRLKPGGVACTRKYSWGVVSAGIELLAERVPRRGKDAVGCPHIGCSVLWFCDNAGRPCLHEALYCTLD